MWLTLALFGEVDKKVHNSKPYELLGPIFEKLVAGANVYEYSIYLHDLQAAVICFNAHVSPLVLLEYPYSVYKAE